MEIIGKDEVYCRGGIVILVWSGIFIVRINKITNLQISDLRSPVKALDRLRFANQRLETVFYRCSSWLEKMSLPKHLNC